MFFTGSVPIRTGQDWQREGRTGDHETWQRHGKTKVPGRHFKNSRGDLGVMKLDLESWTNYRLKFMNKINENLILMISKI